MKNVVVVGGGSGIFNVLKGLKTENINLTSIVTTFDSGGSTGLLRDEFGTLPAGDIRRSLVALAATESDIMRTLFEYRFPDASSLNGHSFGNLLIQALIAISDDEVSAIQHAGSILNIRGNVLPVSVDDAHIEAEFADGTIVQGETHIDIPEHDGSVPIVNVRLVPRATITKEAADALQSADVIIFGPGDLYTSIIPNILVEGFVDAVRTSDAACVYVSNLMTKWGETDGFQVSDFVRTICTYLHVDRIDHVLAHSGAFSESLLNQYAAENAHPVVVDTENTQKYTSNLITSDLAVSTDVVRHDAAKLKEVLMKIL